MCGRIGADSVKRSGTRRREPPTGGARGLSSSGTATPNPYAPVLAVNAMAPGDATTDGDDRPNVLVVHAHNLGQHLGCYGWDTATPAIDGLAAEGARLENAFCTAPHCSPARGSLWTGRYPHNHGLVGLAHLGWSFNEGERTLMEHLRDAGYDTHLFGIQHVADTAAEVGFEHVQGSQHGFTVDEPAREVAERFGTFVGEQGDDGPWFASVGFSEVHREPLVDRCLDCGWTYDLGGYEKPDPDEIEPLPFLPDDSRIREDLAGFHAMVRAVDDGVGEILAALDDAGLADDTIVTFVSDHGMGFPRAMGTCYDPGMEMSWITRWPDELEPTDPQGLASGVDFMPTMLDLVGEQVPDGIDGRSIAPMLRGEDDRLRDRVFHEFTWHSKYTPIRAVRTESHKYIRNYGDQPLVYIPAPLFSAPAGQAVRDEFYGEQRPEEELYDLEQDPHEQDNRIGDAALAAVETDLRNELDDWLETTDDPILEGPWPPTPEQRERVWKSPWIPQQVGH